MRFTVTVSPSAEAELARIYNDAGPDSAAVTRDSNLIDRELRDDAHTKGRPCDGDRIFRLGVLLVFYSVSVEDRLAEILQYAIVPPAAEE